MGPSGIVNPIIIVIILEMRYLPTEKRSGIKDRQRILYNNGRSVGGQGAARDKEEGAAEPEIAEQTSQSVKKEIDVPKVGEGGQPLLEKKKRDAISPVGNHVGMGIRQHTACLVLGFVLGLRSSVATDN
jgi:hypothetical protein